MWCCSCLFFWIFFFFILNEVKLNQKCCNTSKYFCKDPDSSGLSHKRGRFVVNPFTFFPASIQTLVKMSKTAGPRLKPHASQLIPALLEALSTLEPQVLNYLSLRATEQEKVTPGASACQLRWIYLCISIHSQIQNPHKACLPVSLEYYGCCQTECCKVFTNDGDY